MVSKISTIVVHVIFILQACGFSHQSTSDFALGGQDEESNYWIVPSSQDVQDSQGPLLEDDEGVDEDMDEINAFDGQEDEELNSVQDAAEGEDMIRQARKFTLARVRRDPPMNRNVRKFTLARVRRTSAMFRPARKLSLARVRRGQGMVRGLRQLSLARVRRGEQNPTDEMTRMSRQLSLARVRRGPTLQRETRPFSLARIRRAPAMIRKVRQLSLARV